MKENRTGILVGLIILLLFVVGVTRAVLFLIPSGSSSTGGSSAVTAGTTPAPKALQDPVALSVQNGKIVGPDGKPYVLLGVSHSGLEFTCPTDASQVGTIAHLTPTDYKIMHDKWGMNIVRVLVSSELWNYCPSYKASVDAIVAEAKAQKFYVMLSLQWNAPFDLPAERDPANERYGGTQYPLPDTKQDVQFWKDVGARYKDDVNVMFDLLSEPHDVTWQQWHDGGKITVKKAVNPGDFPPYSAAGTYTALGMPALARIVRAAAPTNLILIAGIDYGYNLSQIGQGMAVDDVSNVAYSTHPFDYTSKAPDKWAIDLGLAGKAHAIVATEFGPDGSKCDTAYISKAIEYFNANGISWLAWYWNTGSCSHINLLLQFDGTPNGPWAQYIQDQMLKKARASGIA